MIASEQVYESINELPLSSDCSTTAAVTSQLNTLPTATSSATLPGGVGIVPPSLQSNRWLRYRLHGHSASVSSPGGVNYNRSSSAGYHPGVGSLRRRDYSVDKQTDAVFNEFLRYDPRLDDSCRQQLQPLQRHSSISAVRHQFQQFAGGVMTASSTGSYQGGNGRRNLPLHGADLGIRNASMRRRGPHTVAPLSPPPEEDDGLMSGQTASSQILAASGGLQRPGIGVVGQLSVSGGPEPSRLSPRRCISVDGSDGAGCTDQNGGPLPRVVVSREPVSNGASCGLTVYRHHTALVDGPSNSSLRLQYIDDGATKS